MTRKKFIKNMMSIGYDRNTAVGTAYLARVFDGTYAKAWERELTEHDLRVHELKVWGLWW